MTLKRYISMVLMCCSLSLAGQTGGASQPVVMTDSSGNQWQKVVNIQVVQRPLAPVELYPSGDVLLPRFREKSVEYRNIPAGDTLKCAIQSLSGKAFSKINYYINDSLAFTDRNKAASSFQYRVGAGTFRWSVKAQPSLQRQVARVTVARVSPPQYDTIRNTTEILIKPGKKTAVDSIFQQTVGAGQGIQSYWYGSVPTGRPGEQLKRKKSLIIKANPPVRSSMTPSGMVQITRKREHTLIYTDLMPGDTFGFSVTCRGKSVLSKALLLDEKRQTLLSAVNTPVFTGAVVVRGQKSLVISLRSNKIFKKVYADVVAWRIRPVKADSFYQVTDSLFKSTTTTVYDTTAVSLLDDSLEVAALWNIEADHTGQFLIEIPQEIEKAGQLYNVAYWFGVGDACIGKYAQLEATVPPDWSRPGLPVALGAYGLGKQLVLPASGVTDLETAFTSANQKKSFLTGKKYKKLVSAVPNYGTLSRGALSRLDIGGKDAKTGDPLYRFFLCFRNHSTVNTYLVSLKVAGYYRKVKSTTTTTDFVKTETNLEPISK